ncbi:MAG: hypothetical protein GFH27_549431n39 [Chloroflexi bacterium AL-W]|nr:hypothetical protein [Chloroflexi bacterium AL-N1]NOK71643.1 hypothetical protein [Chloroflexi bacterium AL-N10]NOK78943.1 hypothetical protein [Chloroflexi bacterium AL-N5]NOK86418.1 hypothetical protein [Chloroflexi bacterium AL-W]
MFMAVGIGDSMYEIWPIIFILLISILLLAYRRKVNLSYLFFLSIFWTYLAFAIDKVFFPIHITGDFADAHREGAPDLYVNLIPFYFGPYAALEGSFISSMQNILLTMPFGFGLHFLIQLKSKHYLWIAPALGLVFEGLQYILSLLLGYFYRFVDINDLLFNALGVLIGYGLLRIFAFVYMTTTEKFSIEHEGISAYVYRVAAHAHARS